MAINVKAYLDRIEVKGKLEVNLDCLTLLQKQHLLNIPFENLDIHTKTEIRLDIDRVFTKVITNGRGGFCYELNGMFYELLLELGFEAQLISCQVYKKETGFGKEHAHVAILVKLEKHEYLCDVGFGEFALEPLNLKIGLLQQDLKGEFQIDKCDATQLQVSKLNEGVLTPEYKFENKAMQYNDFEEMCHYTQTSPESHFTQKIIITRPTLTGRISLTGTHLKINEGTKVLNLPLKNKADFDAMLWEHFNIRLLNFPFNPKKDLIINQ